METIADRPKKWKKNAACSAQVWNMEYGMWNMPVLQPCRVLRTAYKSTAAKIIIPYRQNV